MKQRVAVWTLLSAAVLGAYGQTTGFDFVNYDDPDYVTQNAHVRAGLTADGVGWAFTSSYAANWIPLTWVSLMAAGTESSAQHAVNVLLHLASTLLLFAVLCRLTGAVWRSAVVAFLFGVHPLHVESVAWVAERKDALSGFFWMLTLWCYVRYAERPDWRRYGMVLLAFALGLLSKPMLVTLPLVLVLLDYWPLRRKRALLEKAPLAAMALAASVATFVVQRGGGAVTGIEAGNALVSYCAYLMQTIWPVRLAVFYPLGALPAWEIAAAAVVLAGISAAVVWHRRERPYLAVGWAWYLITLLPVIGLVQVGEQAHADRYTYLPLVGVFIAAVWAAPASRWLAAGVCATCLVLTWNQVQYWRNSETLMAHALEVTSDNYVAHDNYGAALRARGELAQALPHFVEAVRIRPQHVEAQNNAGEALLALGRPAEAMPYLEQALRLKPDYPEAHVNLGSVMARMGRDRDAVKEFREALRARAEYPEARAGLGSALAATGNIEEGLADLREAVRLRPDYVDAHYGLGLALAQAGRTDEAIGEFAETVRLAPNDAEAHFNLGTALGQSGRMQEAVAEFREALRLRPAYEKAEINLRQAERYLKN